MPDTRRDGLHRCTVYACFHRVAHFLGPHQKSASIVAAPLYTLADSRIALERVQIRTSVDDAWSAQGKESLPFPFADFVIF